MLQVLQGQLVLMEQLVRLLQLQGLQGQLDLLVQLVMSAQRERKAFKVFKAFKETLAQQVQPERNLQLLDQPGRKAI